MGAGQRGNRLGRVEWKYGLTKPLVITAEWSPKTLITNHSPRRNPDLSNLPLYFLLTQMDRVE
jgi:hypothetical protein